MAYAMEVADQDLEMSETKGKKHMSSGGYGGGSSYGGSSYGGSSYGGSSYGGGKNNHYFFLIALNT